MGMVSGGDKDFLLRRFTYVPNQLWNAMDGCQTIWFGLSMVSVRPNEGNIQFYVLSSSSPLRLSTHARYLRLPIDKY